MNLTPKQAIFIAEYLVDFNGTRAATAAGVPEKSAAVTASRWLRNPAIAATITMRKARRVEKCEDEAERLDEELRRVAYFDPGRLYDEAGNRIPVHLLDEDTRRAISSIEDETRGETRRQTVKLLDKLRAIELAYKRRGLLGENAFSAAVETGSAGLPPDSTIKIVLVRPNEN